VAVTPQVGSLVGNVEGENSREAKTKMKVTIPYRGGLVGLCKAYDGMLRGRAKVGEIEGGAKKGAVCV